MREFQQAVRVLKHTPGFVLVATAVLGLGIGANTVIFSVVNGVLLKPLPFAAPQRLVMLSERRPQPEFQHTVVSPGEFLHWTERAQSLEYIAAVGYDSNTLAADGEPERVSVMLTSASFLPMLGIRMSAGRPFTKEEDAPGHADVAVLSHSLWVRRFGSRQDLINQSVMLDNVATTVVGVLPQGFDFFGEPDVIRPIAFAATDSDDVRHHFLDVFARLKPGVDASRARRELDAIQEDLSREFTSIGTDRVNVTPLDREIVGDLRPVLLVLMASVAFVLLLACTNIANLTLARSIARSRELAVRAALGAGRGQLVRQLLAESAVVGLAGGGVGLLLTFWGIDLVKAWSPPGTPRLAQVSLDATVFGFAVLASGAASLICGLVPAIQLSRPGLVEPLKEGSPGAGTSAKHQRARALLVVSQVALALMLLVGAGLMLGTIRKLVGVNPGFDPARVATFELALPEATYTDPDRQAEFFNRFVARLGQLPGVQAAGAVDVLPLSGNNASSGVTIENRPTAGTSERPNADVRIASDGYLSAMNIRLIRGRWFDARDDRTAPPVAIVNETMAARFWPGEDTLGRRFKRGRSDVQSPWITVVGIVSDVRHRGLDADIRQAFYIPLAQDPQPQMAFVVRGAVAPATIERDARRVLHELDPNLAVFGVQSMSAVVAGTFGSRTLLAGLLGGFSLVGLLLAAVGVYGVIAYTVLQRTKEVGIRVALGASRRDVIRMFVGQGLRLVLAGVAAGLIGSLILTRAMAGLLYRLSPGDPSTLVGATVLLVVAAILATLVPARRALRLDPIRALRSE